MGQTVCYGKTVVSQQELCSLILCIFFDALQNGSKKEATNISIDTFAFFFFPNNAGSDLIERYLQFRSADLFMGPVKALLPYRSRLCRR